MRMNVLTLQTNPENMKNPKNIIQHICYFICMNKYKYTKTTEGMKLKQTFQKNGIKLKRISNVRKTTRKKIEKKLKKENNLKNIALRSHTFTHSKKQTTRSHSLTNIYSKQ